MQFEYEISSLRTKYPFAIARGGHGEEHAVWVRLTDEDGITGWGEAAPVQYYGETKDSVCIALDVYRAAVETARNPFAVHEIEQACEHDLRGNASARCAISSALYDLIGKRLGMPVHSLLGLDPSRSPLSSFTIGLDKLDVVRRKVEEAAEYPILKIKVGTNQDEEILTLIRQIAPDVRIRVDANTAWHPRQAVQRIHQLQAFDIEFVVDGINIKLAKCGGISEALRMIHTARAHNLQVMLGCMVESSLGIAAAAQLAPLVDFADLDGAALLAEDPFAGFSIARGRIHLSGEPGLGVERR